MPEADRKALLKTLRDIDETLGKTWSGYPGFEDLQVGCLERWRSHTDSTHIPIKTHYSF